MRPCLRFADEADIAAVCFSCLSPFIIMLNCLILRSTRVERRTSPVRLLERTTRTLYDAPQPYGSDVLRQGGCC